ncbi:hypothetical protein Kpol_281p2 [Vanderwaltozyma polyspora DSM 70294]|uniref:Major facilitator superfamily (MFS) profile domain-containing protein n=1 Tax=Vanderwaltozyma polyspora (strain ATCC 22028 / DSM 70294 / BCRC 21397 / CBS 2163 / NBRC 10782 / NRRL Y-8283 / UCD 57-17) TaxID=436907 RepID=A7TTA4_VANPO|nr:uncharacterized protein Kpol_281p2 [Vanderwaltozyma polyspora DSM 70294]EDO14501.1 hypothetical protein Kpol_281p2 [Vanderwaltozyma polyspora DSM 70294]
MSKYNTVLSYVLGKNTTFRGKIYDRFPKVYNIIVIGFVASISGLMFGFDISSMSSMIGTQAYKTYFHNPDSTRQGGITSAMAGGSVLGSILSPIYSDAYGRRVSLHVCAVLWLIGSTLQCAAQDVAMLVVGRLIAGIGIGFGVGTAPVYCAEIAPPKIRGAIAGIFQLSVVLGILILYYIGYGAHFIQSTAAFRVTWGIELAPGLALLVCTFFLPESPRWLANKNRWEEATFNICKMNHTSPENISEEVAIQLQAMKDQVMNDKEAANFTYRDMLRKKTIRKTIVGMSAHMWQQLSGINVMNYYVVYIFEMAGYRGDAALIAGSIHYCLNVGMTVISLFIIDRVGRRPLLLIGGPLMFTWLFAVAGTLAVHSVPVPGGVNGNPTVSISIPEDDKSAAKGVIACCFLFVATFAVTWGTGVWVYSTEIYNNLERAKGGSLSASMNMLFNFSIGLFVPPAFRSITWKTYIIFGVFTVVGTIHAFFMFPETKGKTLEEIDQMWAANIPAWRSASWRPPSQIDVDLTSHVLDESSSEIIEDDNKETDKPMVTHIEDTELGSSSF